MIIYTEMPTFDLFSMSAYYPVLKHYRKRILNLTLPNHNLRGVELWREGLEDFISDVNRTERRRGQGS